MSRWLNTLREEGYVAFTIKEIEADLNQARDVFAKRRASTDLEAGIVKSVEFYHSTRTRHHALIFKLDGGKTVFKELGDNALEVLAAVTRAKHVAVWYDQSNTVQQFVLNHEL